MKKFLSILIIIVVSLSLTACSNKDNKKPEKLGGEITVWAHAYSGDKEKEDAMWNRIIADFKEKTGVTVKFEQIPWANKEQKILTALVAGNGPDIFYLIPDQMPQFAATGVLEPLDKYLDKEDIKDFEASVMETTKWKDEIFGLPILQSANTLVYNVDVIEAIGESPDNLPKTWEDFEAWAKKAKEKDIYALGYGGGGSLNGTFYPFLWQAGGDVLDENNNILINTPESIKAFEFVNKMYQNGWIPKDSISAVDHRSYFEEGKMLASNSTGIMLSHLDQLDGFRYVIGDPLTDKAQYTYGAVGMFSTPVNSPNKEAAIEFIKFATNTENQKEFNLLTNYVPTRTSAKSIFDGKPELEKMAEVTKYIKSGVIHPVGRAVMPGIQAKIQAMFEGTLTPEEAAKESVTVIETELKK